MSCLLPSTSPFPLHTFPPLHSFPSFSYAGDMLKKLVQETYPSRLARVSVNLVQVFFLACSWAEICILLQNMSGTWHKPCNVIGQLVVVQETVMNELASNFSCKFLVKVLVKFLERLLPALPYLNSRVQQQTATGLVATLSLTCLE